MLPSLDRAVMADIRREMELAGFKWDAQVGDVTTLAPFPFVLERATWKELSVLAEALFRETEALEAALVERPDLYAVLGLPRKLRRILAGGAALTPSAGRVMRFDFHFTTEGWRVSEVNSDVPGGFTESTNFARLVAEHFTSLGVAGDPAAALVAAISQRKHEEGMVALTCAPGHMEDHQVVAYLAMRSREAGVAAEVVPPSVLRWKEGRASIESAWLRGPVAAVVRFYQSEWLAELSRPVDCTSMFVGGKTPVSNPGVAALSESKRLPLVWDRIGADLPTWRRLLPETRSLSDAPWQKDDGWLIKSAYSNTGDTVSMRDALSLSEWRRRAWAARLCPGSWVAQRRFDVVPIEVDGALEYPCIGVYVVERVAAGAYARSSSGRVIDAFARDVAVLVDDASALT